MISPAFAVERSRQVAPRDDDEEMVEPLPVVGKRTRVELLDEDAWHPDPESWPAPGAREPVQPEESPRGPDPVSRPPERAMWPGTTSRPAPVAATTPAPGNPGPVVLRATAPGATAAPAARLARTLDRLTGSGAALPTDVAARMARLFGHDLSHVRVHADSDAASAAHELGARAFTVGDDIYFGAGELAPGTPRGDALLAHELTHVVQFDLGRLATGGPAQLSHPDDATEREASAMEARAGEAAASPAHVDDERRAERTGAPSGEPGPARRHSDDALAQPRAVEPDRPARSPRPAPALARHTYRSARAIVQRAIGFEIQTHFVVRQLGVDWLDYKAPVFLDLRGGGAYFEMVVDHAPVPQHTQADAELHNLDAAVLEIVLPHVEDRAEMKKLVQRADVMRQALATMTANGTAESRIEAVVAKYQQLLATAGIADDATGRAAGIRMPNAIVGQDGEPDSASTVLPQVTVAVPLADLPFVVSKTLSEEGAVAPSFQTIATYMIKTVEYLREWQLPPDTLGLALLVESYLYCAKSASGPIAYPKEIAPWMARTDFHSMYETLGPDSKEAWAVYVDSIAKANAPDPQAHILPHGFPSGTGLATGPKIHDWLDSIAAPERFKLDAVDTKVILDQFYADLESALRVIAQTGGVDVHQVLVDGGASPGALALEHAIQTPGGERAMPDENDVDEMLDVLGYTAMSDAICLGISRLKKGLESRDLMSRGAVAQSASSMGSMKVHTTGLEQGMAVLENRMMPPWQTKPVKREAEPDAIQVEDDERDDDWIGPIMAAFDYLKWALAKAAELRKPPDDQQGPDDHQHGPDDGPPGPDDDHQGPDQPRSPGSNTSRKRARSPDRSGKDGKSSEDQWHGGSRGDQVDTGGKPQSELSTNKRVESRGRVMRDSSDHPTSVRYGDRTYAVHQVPANGDCFYRCCADFLADGRNVAGLRQLLGQSAMLTQPEQQAALQPGSYAGDREIAALASALGIAIITHEGTYADNSVARSNPVGVATNGTLDLLHLFNPAEAQGHFDRMS